MPQLYRNFDIQLFEYRLEAGEEQCKVLVPGEDPIAEAVVVRFPKNLRQRLAHVERAQLPQQELIALGADIAAILFPAGVRSRLEKKLPRRETDQRLRIRIRCEGFALHTIAWEYAYLGFREGGPNPLAGFLALNRNTSLVRYQLTDSESGELEPPGERKLSMVAAFSSPNGQAKLDLEKEKGNIRRALQGLTRIEEPRFLDHTTVTGFGDTLNGGPADIVHFAGHGEKDNLLFEKADCSADPYPSGHLAVRLMDKNVRLVVLSACESGNGSGENAWAGVAPALVDAGIPAVVGMQYRVFDDSAVEFGRVFYGSLARGRTLDEAITEARKAVFDLERGEHGGRDFGVPVLYLRSSDGDDPVLFPEDAPSAAAPPAVRPLNLDAVLRQIEQLVDYKGLHDALDKSRMGGLNVMLTRIDDFPARSNTVTEFTQYVANFKAQLRAIRNIVERRHCEANLVTDLRDEFAGTVAELETAVRERNAAGLKEAVTELESHITQYSSKINSRLAATAEYLDLDRLVEVLRQALALIPERAAARDALKELASLSDDLKNKVDLHHAYQLIDDKLSLIRRKQSDEYRELVKGWALLSNRIKRLHPEWLKESPDLVEVTARIDVAIKNENQQEVRDAFDNFCSIVQADFSTIDTDLLRICSDVQARAVASIAAITVH